MAFNFSDPGSSKAPPSNPNAASFSFGAPAAASANKGAGLFGQSNATTGTLFGPQSTGGAQASPSGIFSAGLTSEPATASTAGTDPASQSLNAPSSPKKGLFGAAASSSLPTSASSGLFGPPSAAKPALGGGNMSAFNSGDAKGPATGLFGTPSSGLGANAGQSQPSSSTTGATSLFASTGNSLFGSKTQAASADQNTTSATSATATPAKPLFSMASTTPAGAPPSTFPKPSLFGNTSSTNATELDASKPKDASAPTPSILGGGSSTAKPAASGIFSNSALDTGKPTSELFGNVASKSGPLSAPKTGSGPDAAGSGQPAAGLFGSGLSSQAMPSKKPASAEAPTSSLFGTTPAAPSSSSTGLFGSSKLASDSAAPASKSTSALNQGGLLSGAPSNTDVSNTKNGSSLFGTPIAAQSSQSTSTPALNSGTALPTTTTASSSAEAAQPSSKRAAESPEKDKKNTTPAGQSSSTPTPLGASAHGPPPQMPRLKNKTMEDIVTRWASDLAKYQKEFKEQATIISGWDRNLVDNGEKIQKLYLDTFEAERASHEIERQLAAVEGQQDELESWLNRYESEVQDMFAKQFGPGEQLAGPDQERERTYKLAEKLTRQLEEKSRDLSKIVEEINELSGTLNMGRKAEDPLSQIVRVLNGHLTQLQWIDTTASALQAKVSAAQKSSRNSKNHYAITENDAAESFYRSYMGKK